MEEIDNDENRSFSDWLHILHYSAPKQEEEKPKTQSKGMDLIENFLSSNPQIIADPVKKTKREDLSEKSTDSK